MRIIAIVVAVGIIGFLIGLSGALGAGPSCHAGGTGLFTTPDNACTPGAYQALSRSAVCTPKDRPGLTAADHRKILSEYGVPHWTGRDGELDHRVPVFLGGLTTEQNIWPERGSIPNRKDALELLVRRRVCVERNMRVRTAVRLFLADWVHAYQALVPLTAKP
jgi:hypothetical protein